MCIRDRFHSAPPSPSAPAPGPVLPCCECSLGRVWLLRISQPNRPASFLRLSLVLLLFLQAVALLPPKKIVCKEHNQAHNAPGCHNQDSHRYPVANRDWFLLGLRRSHGPTVALQASAARIHRPLLSAPCAALNHLCSSGGHRTSSLYS